jgi:hypothetical protein
MKLRVGSGILAGLVLLGYGTAARAQNSYWDYSCQQLWQERNGIYKAAGYCFKTARAIAAFGNAGCQYDAMGDVPLTQGDQDAVAMIVRVERSKGCGE